MSQYLWIAIAATIVVIAAHGLLFWWFLCKKDKSAPESEEPEDRG
jgi:plastocyanin domain-containing protein